MRDLCVAAHKQHNISRPQFRLRLIFRDEIEVVMPYPNIDRTLFFIQGVDARSGLLGPT